MSTNPLHVYVRLHPRLFMEEQQAWETALLKKIETVIQETFTSCMKEFQITAAPPTTEKSEPPAQPDLPDETEANIEAFLDCF